MDIITELTKSEIDTRKVSELLLIEIEKIKNFNYEEFQNFYFFDHTFIFAFMLYLNQFIYITNIDKFIETLMERYFAFLQNYPVDPNIKITKGHYGNGKVHYFTEHFSISIENFPFFGGIRPIVSPMMDGKLMFNFSNLGLSQILILNTFGLCNYVEKMTIRESELSLGETNCWGDMAYEQGFNKLLENIAKREEIIDIFKVFPNLSLVLVEKSVMERYNLKDEKPFFYF